MLCYELPRYPPMTLFALADCGHSSISSGYRPAIGIVRFAYQYTPTYQHRAWQRRRSSQRVCPAFESPHSSSRALTLPISIPNTTARARTRTRNSLLTKDFRSGHEPVQSHPSSQPRIPYPSSSPLSPLLVAPLSQKHQTINLRSTPPSPQAPHIIRLHGSHADKILRVRHMRVQLRELCMEMCVLTVSVR